MANYPVVDSGAEDNITNLLEKLARELGDMGKIQSLQLNLGLILLYLDFYLVCLIFNLYSVFNYNLINIHIIPFIFT